MPGKTVEILQPINLRAEGLTAGAKLNSRQPDLRGSFQPFSPSEDTVTIAEMTKPSLSVIFESVLDQAQDIAKRSVFKAKLASIHTLVSGGERLLTSVSHLKLAQSSKGSERLRYRPRRPRRRRCPHNRLRTEGCHQCDEDKKKHKL